MAGAHRPSSFLPLSFVYAFVCLSAWYLCRAFPLDAGARVLNIVVVYIVAAAVASSLWIVFADSGRSDSMG